MAAVRLSFDMSQYNTATRRARSRIRVSVSRALNRCARTGRTVLVREIARDMKVPQNQVRDRVLLDRSTSARLVATFYASAKRLGVIAFNARGPEPSMGRGRGVTAKLPGRRYPHAFIATMPSGHRGVFERVPGKYMVRRGPKGGGGRREAIRELFGPSIAHVFSKVRPAGERAATEAFPKHIQSELKFALTIEAS